MKGDFSKETFNAKKHFHDVLMQQGRVLLDSEWNEQKEITNHRIETETTDVIGAAGAPVDNDGFEIVTVDAGGNPVSPGVNIMISKGRFYVDGILCENEADVLFALQPDFNGTPLPAVADTYLFYLDVWQRHITWLEDTDIREVALNGPDTTTRTKTVWQVKCVDANGLNNCKDAVIPEAGLSTGKMKARTEVSSGTTDPCGLVTSGGYRRLENQLYRVEIHRRGTKNTATFTGSRDNGSVLVKWEDQDTVNKNKLIVSSTGRDELLGFKSGNWIELVDEATDLLQQPGILVQVSNVEGNIITINPATILRPDGSVGGSAPLWTDYNKPRIRRWDMVKDAASPGTDKGEIALNKSTWIKLEDGVEVAFSIGEYSSGDYWLIPARTNTGKIEWAPDDYQSPRGIVHHFAKLAIATLTVGAAPSWRRDSDCRLLFPPLTALRSLSYAGGDGQEARPLTELPAPLRVSLTNGQLPMVGEEITFEIKEGGGQFLPSNLQTIKAITDAEGIAECKWQLGLETALPARQLVKASYIKNSVLIDAPVYFTAKLTPPQLFYVSGDGQNGSPGSLLDGLLSVGVSYEQFPATGRNIRFEITSGGGRVCLPDGSNPATGQTMTTGADGIVSCKWRLGNSGEQKLTATLLNADGDPMHIPIIYTADFTTEGKKRCSVTVGRKGDYATLEEAFEKLKEEKDICICLLPPERNAEGIEREHRVDGLRVTEKEMICISGCGASLHISGRGMILSAEKIELNDIGFINEEMVPQQIVLEGRDVHTQGCTFNYGKQTPTLIPVFVIISPSRSTRETSSLHFNKNTLNKGFTLAVSAGVDAWLEQNEIDGDVFLLTDSVNTKRELPLEFNEKISAPFWDRMGDSTRKLAEAEIVSKLTFQNRNETLFIHNNRIARLQTDLGKIIKIPSEILQQPNAQVRGYQNILVTDNIFTTLPGSLSGDNITFVNNQFQIRGTDSNLIYLLGHNGMVIGNIAQRDTGAIETLFDTGRLRKEPNLCMVI